MDVCGIIRGRVGICIQLCIHHFTEAVQSFFHIAHAHVAVGIFEGIFVLRRAVEILLVYSGKTGAGFLILGLVELVTGHVELHHGKLGIVREAGLEIVHQALGIRPAERDGAHHLVGYYF